MKKAEKQRTKRFRDLALIAIALGLPTEGGRAFKLRREAIISAIKELKANLAESEAENKALIEKNIQLESGEKAN